MQTLDDYVKHQQAAAVDAITAQTNKATPRTAPEQRKVNDRD